MAAAGLPQWPGGLPPLQASVAAAASFDASGLKHSHVHFVSIAASSTRLLHPGCAPAQVGTNHTTQPALAADTQASCKMEASQIRGAWLGAAWQALAYTLYYQKYMRSKWPVEW